MCIPSLVRRGSLRKLAHILDRTYTSHTNTNSVTVNLLLARLASRARSDPPPLPFPSPSEIPPITPGFIFLSKDLSSFLMRHESSIIFFSPFNDEVDSSTRLLFNTVRARHELYD